MSDVPKTHGWRWWLQWYKASTYLFMMGIGVASLGCHTLSQLRPSLLPSPWATVAFCTFMLSFLWWLWVSFPSLESVRVAPSPHSREAGPLFLSLTVIFVLRWQWDQNWSVALLGPAAALALWFMASEQEIKPFAAAAAWIFAGFAAFQLPWPNPQRFLLVMVVGGLATALQGVFAFFSFYRILRQKLVEAC